MSKEKKVTEEKSKEELGNDVILSDGVAIRLEGVVYKIRRLGIADCFRLWSILKDVYAKGGTEIALRMQGVDTGPEGFGTLVMLGMPYVQDDMLSFFADALNVKIEDLNNPDKFPMDSILLLIEALFQHQDVKAFLSRLIKVQEAVEKLVPMPTGGLTG